MKTFEFKSQICTTKEQSERLLALGIKKETADMYITNMSWNKPDYIDDWQICSIPYCDEVSFLESNGLQLEKTVWSIIPAWSLHRLMEMMPPSIKDGYHYSLIYDIHRDAIGYICFANGGLQRPYNRLLWDTQSTDPFDNIIVCIEWLIKEGYFNKDYLEEKK